MSSFGCFCFMCFKLAAWPWHRLNKKVPFQQGSQDGLQCGDDRMAGAENKIDDVRGKVVR